MTSPSAGSGASLSAKSWDDWCKMFDGRDLVFLFQERQRAGNQSNFYPDYSLERLRDWRTPAGDGNW